MKRTRMVRASILTPLVVAGLVAARSPASALTVDFDAGTGQPPSYTEAGITVAPVIGSENHVHLGDNDGNTSPDLMLHPGCCSTPYRFTFGSGAFSVKQLDFVLIGGSHSFTASSGAVVSPTSSGTVTFPSAGWLGITSFDWHDAGTQFTEQGVIDNLVFCPGDCSDGSPCTVDTCDPDDPEADANGCVHSGDPGADLDDCLDDFLCDRVVTTPGTPKFAQIPSLHLVDQFEDQTFVVRKVKHLCLPADKNDGKGVVDPATHLVSYLIRPVSGVHTRQTNIQVNNQLGELHVDTIKADLLLVPSGKSLISPPPEPDPSAHNVDHYKCYKMRVTPGTPRFPRGLQVIVSDQFTNPAKRLDLRRPRHLCVPVDKEGEGIQNAAANLLCYKARPASGQPKHVRQTGVYVNNQLGGLQFNTIKEFELCIPTTVTP